MDIFWPGYPTNCDGAAFNEEEIADLVPTMDKVVCGRPSD